VPVSSRKRVSTNFITVTIHLYDTSLQTAHLPALAALGSAAPPLKAVYSRSEKSSRELAEAAVEILNLKTTPSIYHDEDASVNLDVLLGRKDITIVSIALPITVQPGIVLKSLEAGKHVLSEKPIAPDVKKGLEMIGTYHQLYKNKGQIWRVAENFEAEAGYRAAASAIQSGKIGKVIFFKALAVMNMDKDSKWYKRPWRTVPDVSFSEFIYCASLIAMLYSTKVDFW
jgi:predicted dehydrogenase